MLIWPFMIVTRIVKLVDGEELISFETVERTTRGDEDPRSELLEHRKAAADRAPRAR